jgi:hypothetical protein
MHLFVATKPITRVDDGNWITISISSQPDVWMLDQQVVQSIAELDELFLCWGLLGGVHTGIVMGFL